MGIKPGPNTRNESARNSLRDVNVRLTSGENGGVHSTQIQGVQCMVTSTDRFMGTVQLSVPKSAVTAPPKRHCTGVLLANNTNKRSSMTPAGMAPKNRKYWAFGAMPAGLAMHQSV